MSIYLRQREALQQELNQVCPVVKTICKLKPKNNKKEKPIVPKQLLILVTVPKTLPIFIKSSVELKLALQCPPERCLGGLRENPCTYNYKVCRTDQYKDLFFFTLEQYDTEQFSKEQICQIIRNLHDCYSEEAALCIENRFKILENFQKHLFLTDSDLKEFEALVDQYPYQCTIQNVKSNCSTLSQRIINQKFLDMMGITKEMMFEHLRETNALPTIFDLDGSLKNWCHLARFSLEGVSQFQFYINTYEGQQFKCEVEQKQMFKRFNDDPDSIVFIEFRIVKPDEFLRKHLFREERILRNHQDYFNQKNISLAINQFKNQTRYLDAQRYQSTKPCGYKRSSQSQTDNEANEADA